MGLIGTIQDLLHARLTHGNVEAASETPRPDPMTERAVGCELDPTDAISPRVGRVMDSVQDDLDRIQRTLDTWQGPMSRDDYDRIMGW